MTAGHSHALYLHADSPVHRLAPECKLVGAVLLVAAIVSTPREAVWAFAAEAALVAAIAAVARLSAGHVARRMVVEAPFVVAALALPFVAEGPRVAVAGVALSVSGLWAAWNVVAKATLGVAVSVVLASSTPVADLLRGLRRLRVPATLTAIMTFMVRYLDVIVADVGRARTAMLSRAYDPRWLTQARGVAQLAGTIFVRSYERGERVYLAMLSRGYDGAVPDLGTRRASAGQWAAALAVPAAAGAVAAAAWANVGPP